MKTLVTVVTVVTLVTDFMSLQPPKFSDCKDTIYFPHHNASPLRKRHKRHKRHRGVCVTRSPNRGDNNIP